MNLKDCHEAKDTASSKASEIGRNLAYAGIAIIWVFRNTGPGPMLPRELVLPGVLIVVALALDFVQYLTASLIWAGFARTKELRGVKDTDDFRAPRQINWPANAAYFFKFVVIMIAYFLLFAYLLKLL